MNNGTKPEHYRVTYCVPHQTPVGIGMMTLESIVPVTGNPPWLRECPFGRGFVVDGEWFPLSSVVKVVPINGAPMFGARPLDQQVPDYEGE